MAPSVQSVKGIGPAAAEALARHGVVTVDQLAASTAEALSQVPGFTLARAQRAIAAAAALASSPAPVADEKSEASKPALVEATVTDQATAAVTPTEKAHTESVAMMAEEQDSDSVTEDDTQDKKKHKKNKKKKNKKNKKNKKSKKKNKKKK
jgi:hypothetical protein